MFGTMPTHNDLAISVLCWRAVPDVYLVVLLGTRLNLSQLISNVL